MEGLALNIHGHNLRIMLHQPARQSGVIQFGILIRAGPKQYLSLIHIYVFGKERFVFDTAEIRNALGGLPLNLPEVIEWVKGYLQEGMRQAESPEADSQQNL